MKRRQFIGLLGGAAAWPVTARAQHANMPVIGYLSATNPEPDLLRGFHQGLKEGGGYVEGDNVAVEYRWADNQPGQLAKQVGDPIRRRVTVIAVLSAPASLAAAKATTTVPIVFMVPEDPVRLGLVTSLARPGGNATGVNFFVAELATKRLELLRMLVPAVSRVAMLLNPGEPTIAAVNRRDVEAAAGAMGLVTRFLHASSIAEIDAAFATIANERPDALFISSGPFFTNRRVQLAHLATRYALPAVHGSRSYPEVGGLMSYGTSVAEANRQAGAYVVRILKGTKPADLPVVQLTKFDLVINAHAARMLGLTVPPSLLAVADEVIE